MNTLVKNYATWAEIDLRAIRHNLKEIRRLLGPETKLMAVVKADAYGHGAVEVSKAVLDAGADYLSVANFNEGEILRAAGIRAPILLLSESVANLADQIVEQNLTPTVYTPKLAQRLSEAAAKSGKIVPVHLKVDTGMGRVGVVDGDAQELIDYILGLKNLKIEGIFTHFAKADESEIDYTAGQIERFNRVLERLQSKNGKILRHAANSAATIQHQDSHYDMVRVGLCLYGLYPPNIDRRIVDLIPALSFKTRIMYLKKISQGESLSYGATFTADQDTYIATLPVGYADGLSRSLSNRGVVLVRGQRYPIVGCVCMDLTLIDLGPQTDAQIGDEAVLIGHQGLGEISADELAALEDTINYEVVCGIGKRVPRVYIN
jgi:alanine racemase